MPVEPLNLDLLGALALPMLAAHTLGDHPFQPSTWAQCKGECTHAGRIACAKHTAVIVSCQLLAVGTVVVLAAVAISPLAFLAGLAFTGWSHYWADRRTTLAGLWAAIGKTEFATMGTPRPGRDDAAHLGTGAYRLDQDWHLAWLAISALIFAATGLLLTVLVSLAVMLMVVCILASRHGRTLLARTAS